MIRKKLHDYYFYYLSKTIYNEIFSNVFFMYIHMYDHYYDFNYALCIIDNGNAFVLFGCIDGDVW